ncbi:shikimate dehydrogenase [Actinoplanes sp. CA-054009]
MQQTRRAAVCGKPIAHSLSPVIHTAGFEAAGLTNWRYTSFEVDELGLPGLVESLGAEWAGLSLTMPLKETALRLAAEASTLAVATGAANTLVRQDDGSWYADNTDATGMIRVLREAGAVAPRSVTVLGGGGTARAALAAAAALGVPEVVVVTRRVEARAELAPAAEALGIRLVGHGWEDAGEALSADAVISTVPKGAADHLALSAAWRAGTVLFDAIYDPWPTPLAESALARGLSVISGLDLLLAQAVGQFSLFTGVLDVPEGAMREALFAAAGGR